MRTLPDWGYVSKDATTTEREPSMSLRGFFSKLIIIIRKQVRRQVPRHSNRLARSRYTAEIVGTEADVPDGVDLVCPRPCLHL